MVAAAAQWGCYEAGMIGYVLAWAALGVGPGLWIGYTAIGRHYGELYFVLGALTGLVTVALQYMLTALYHPLPSLATITCGDQYEGLMPSVSVALLYHFLVMARAHDLHLGQRMAWISTHLRAILFMVGVPAIVVWSHNATLINCVWGGLLGSLCGLVLSVTLIVGLAPRLPYANGWWFTVCNMGHQPDLLARYDAKHPDHPISINYSWAYLNRHMPRHICPPHLSSSKCALLTLSPLVLPQCLRIRVVSWPISS